MLSAVVRTVGASDKRYTHMVVNRTYDRWWEVRDPKGELVCVTVYKRVRLR